MPFPNTQSILSTLISLFLLTVAVAAQGQTLISEIRIDQPGTDNDEFFELSGPANTSLDSLTYLVIGDGATGSGTIEAVVSLSGESLDDEGFFVAAESSFSLGTADLITSINFENSDNVTHVLVEGFSGNNGDDLDTNDDGVPDVTPWSLVRDAVGLVESISSGDQYYGAALGFADIGPDGSFVPAYVCRDGAIFKIGAFDPLGGNDTPGRVNSCDEPAPPVPLEVAIHDVQGTGSSVAISDLVTVEAVVTGLFEDNDVVEAFFLQEEDADADADPNSSEGIFVFCDRDCGTVAVNQLVAVTGIAEEFFGMSQIDTTGEYGSIELIGDGSGTVSPTPVSLPAPASTLSAGTFEALEGMLVVFPDKLVVSEYFQLARFGQLVLTVDERPIQFTQASAPSVGGFNAYEADLARKRIILDDLDNDQNDAIFGPAADEPYFYPDGGLNTSNFFRGGDSFTNLTGVLHWSWAGFGGTDAWRLRPVPGGIYSPAPENIRDYDPDELDGNVTVASFNVLNYFTTLDTGAVICGPEGNFSCRGANSTAELERQTAKIVSALTELNADIVGLLEIENNAVESVATLVAALNAASDANYEFIDTGTIGSDVIKVALIYNADVVKPKLDFAVLDNSVDARFLDTKNRPILAQTFKLKGNAEKRFTVAVGHLKSKGSNCNDVSDPDLGDGQGNCNGTRTAAVQALSDWLASDPTGSKDPDYLIIGDLNSYAMEDPITALEAAGYQDLVETHNGSSEYSSVFDGRLGYLDHALANESLAGQVQDVLIWHINADEINVFDYNDDIRDPGEASFERESSAQDIFEANAFRSSDHDPVVVGLELTKK